MFPAPGPVPILLSVPGEVKGRLQSPPEQPKSDGQLWGKSEGKRGSPFPEHLSPASQESRAFSRVIGSRVVVWLLKVTVGDGGDPGQLTPDVTSPL